MTQEVLDYEHSCDKVTRNIWYIIAGGQVRCGMWPFIYIEFCWSVLFLEVEIWSPLRQSLAEGYYSFLLQCPPAHICNLWSPPQKGLPAELSPAELSPVPYLFGPSVLLGCPNSLTKGRPFATFVIMATNCIMYIYYGIHVSIFF